VRPLKFLTCLAPSIPRAFFEGVVASVAGKLGRPAVLECETSVSGPSLASRAMAESGFSGFRAVYDAFYRALGVLGVAGQGV